MRKTHRNELSYSQLEPRQLLAGNLDVMLDGTDLIVVGDNQANQVAISRGDTGALVVAGLDTTINGRTGPFVAGSNVLGIDIALGGGNDEATVDKVIVHKHLRFFGNANNDRLTITDSYAGSLFVEAGSGNDVVDLDLITGKSAVVNLGSGDNVFAATALFAGRHLILKGGHGNNTVAANTLVVNKDLSIDFGAGNDQILLAGESRVHKKSRIHVGGGDDFVGVLPSQNSANVSFRKSLHLNAGSGNDDVASDNNTQLMRRSGFDGGDGFDSLDQAAAIVAQGNRVKNFENSVVDVPGILDSIFEKLSEADIDPNIFGGEVSRPVELILSSNPLIVAENDDPVNVDSELILEGAATQQILGAEVRIGDFQVGQEALIFSNSNGISGAFNTNTGTLRLTGTALIPAYQRALRDVTYEFTGENPPTETRQFRISVTSDQEPVADSRDFRVVAANDGPVITLSRTSATVQPLDLPIVIDDQLTVADTDDTQLESAVVAIVNGFVEGEDLLAFQSVAGIVGTFDPSTGALTFSGDAALSAWQTVLRSVTYTNDSQNPTEGLRSLRFTVNDGQAMDSADFELTVTGETMMSNRFTVSENDSNGTVIGNVETTGQFDSPMIYQFANAEIDPGLLLNADDHLAGESDAPVVLIEYLDLQCPSCAAIHPSVLQLEAEFLGDLLVVRRHFPLEAIHVNARAAARASEAAGRQDKFEAMVDLLFANQGDWQSAADPTPFFEDYANQLALDLTQFGNDTADPDVDARITRDQAVAIDLGAMSTPTFFLDGAVAPTDPTALEASIQSAVDALDQVFSIDRITGEIIVLDSLLLDAMTEPTVELTVLVKDASGNMENVAVVIDVTS